ncbi:MAG TPA: hypothetical protein VGO80_00725 [Solirubrobacteraceae bacterium]|jgi:hypothetical protein|nr:hypothetical protein [Solirubrobacteraceae bacterium]
MRDGYLDALTGRRLGGALFVLCGVLVAAIVLWPSGDDGNAEPPKVQPVRIVSIPQLGLAFAHPRTWKRTIAGRVIRLRSPDGAAVLTFASPTEGRHALQVKAQLKDLLRKRFAGAKIVRDGPARLGRRKVTSFEISGVTAGSGETRALVLVGSSAYRTYAVTLLTPALPSAKRLVEAQQILATVRLAKPVAPRR